MSRRGAKRCITTRQFDEGLHAEQGGMRPDGRDVGEKTGPSEAKPADYQDLICRLFVQPERRQGGAFIVWLWRWGRMELWIGVWSCWRVAERQNPQRVLRVLFLIWLRG